MTGPEIIYFKNYVEFITITTSVSKVIIEVPLDRSEKFFLDADSLGYELKIEALDSLSYDSGYSNEFVDRFSLPLYDFVKPNREFHKIFRRNQAWAASPGLPTDLSNQAGTGTFTVGNCGLDPDLFYTRPTIIFNNKNYRTEKLDFFKDYSHFSIHDRSNPFSGINSMEVLSYIQLLLVGGIIREEICNMFNTTIKKIVDHITRGL